MSFIFCIKTALLLTWAISSVFGSNILKYEHKGSTRNEEGLPGRNVTGSWSWIDALGKQRTIWYSANEKGFQAYGDIVPTVDHGGTPTTTSDPMSIFISTKNTTNNNTGSTNFASTLNISSTIDINSTEFPHQINGTDFILLRKMRPPTETKMRVSPIMINPVPLKVNISSFQTISGLHTGQASEKSFLAQAHTAAKSISRNETPQQSTKQITKPKPMKVVGDVNLNTFYLPLTLSKSTPKPFSFKTKSNSSDYYYYDYYYYDDTTIDSSNNTVNATTIAPKASTTSSSPIETTTTKQTTSTRPSDPFDDDSIETYDFEDSDEDFD